VLTQIRVETLNRYGIVIQALTAAGVEARYFELDSDLGHSSSGPEHAKWSPVLRDFLAPLVAQLN